MNEMWCIDTVMDTMGNTYLLNYLFTPCCGVHLDKLTGLKLVKKFPAFHGTRRFINALTSVRHLPLYWANPIQSIYPHPTSWRSILILSTHLRLGLPSGLHPSGFPSNTLFTYSGKYWRKTSPTATSSTTYPTRNCDLRQRGGCIILKCV